MTQIVDCVKLNNPRLLPGTPEAMNHDQNFKNLILDYPRQALAFFAGAEAHEIDESARIIQIRQEQLKNRLGDRFRELDVPMLVEWPDGRREALLFVLEEESDPRRFSIHRLAIYCLELAELFKTDRVVPVVIFLRDGRVRADLTLGGDRHIFLNFRYLACDLQNLPFEKYRDSQNIVARLTLPNMRYDPGQRIEVFAQAVRGLRLLEPDPEKQIKYAGFIDIYSALDDNERQQFTRKYPEEAQTMSTFAERFINEGMQQGMQEGLQQGIQKGRQEGRLEGQQEGMQQGEARLLLRLLQRKFGELPETVKQRIEAADADTLLTWSDRVLSATTLQEVVR